MKEKHRIEGDNLMVSTDGGKTWQVKGKATQAEKDSYAAHKAKQATEVKKEEVKKESKPRMSVGARRGSDVAYDVYAPETMKAAEDKGYTISKIDPSVQYTGTSVGSQSIWDPESGFYYKEGAPRPGKAGLDHYMKLHAEAIAEYPGGAEQWKKDHLEAANKKDKLGRYGRGDKAIEHVINKVDQNYYDATGKRLIDKNKPDWNVPGVQLFNLPGVYKKGKLPEKTPAPTVDIKQKTPGPATVRSEFKKRYTKMPQPPVKAPWWMQDIVKTTGDAMDLARIKKYMPWQAEPEVYLPEATFYDPARELAANAEQANIQTQGLAAFTGPQALSARSSQIQGQAAKNAADILARYNNLNVGVANQLSQERTNIMNTAAQNQANLDTQLWDKYTIANQQFDNAKNLARQHLRQSYIDAITNRAKTQALNTLYPNYYTDPSRGGFVEFRGDPNGITPTRPNFTNDYLDALEVTGDHNRAMDYLKIQKGMTDRSGYGYDESANYLRNQKYPGTGAAYSQQTQDEQG